MRFPCIFSKAFSFHVQITLLCVVICTIHAKLEDSSENVTESLVKEGDTKETEKEVGSLDVDSVRKFSLTAKRHPKFGFDLSSLPGFNPSSSTATPNLVGSVDGNGNPISQTKLGFPGTGLDLASTAILIKGGVLTGIAALKAAVIPPLFVGAVIIFLIAGAVFFTCNIINCGGLVPTTLPSIFNRNGYEYYEQQFQPVYQTLEDSYKKYE